MRNGDAMDVKSKGKKSVWLALFLNCIVPGLGYTYIEKCKKFIIIFIINIIIIFLPISMMFLGLSEDKIIIIILCGRIGILIYTLFDIYKLTKRYNEQIIWDSSNKNPKTGDNYSLAITSLVLGITSLIAWLIPIFGVPVTITGLVLGILGMESSKRNVSIAGIIVSIVGFVFSIINGVTGAYLGATGQLFKYSSTSTPLSNLFLISPPPGSKLTADSETANSEVSTMIDSYADLIDVYQPNFWEAYFLLDNSTYNSVYEYYKNATSLQGLQFVDTYQAGDKGKVYSFANKKSKINILVNEKQGTVPAGVLVFYYDISLFPDIKTSRATAKFDFGEVNNRKLTETAYANQQKYGGSSECVEWSMITLNDVGKKKCVYGTIIKQRSDATALYLIFSPEYDDFYFISYGNWYYPGIEGNCALAYGEIKQLGQAPVMVIDNYMLRQCE
ncbi:MAG: DUF4190 domain-containing protein [Bacteroidales bacterium]|nr:DUF4190 domain-containing protein [Bacteroidales bacterium]